jgi:hypothetical protein
VYGEEGHEMIIAATGKAVRKPESSKPGKLESWRVGRNMKGKLLRILKSRAAKLNESRKAGKYMPLSETFKERLGFTMEKGEVDIRCGSAGGTGYVCTH